MIHNFDSLDKFHNIHVFMVKTYDAAIYLIILFKYVVF